MTARKIALARCFQNVTTSDQFFFGFVARHVFLPEPLWLLTLLKTPRIFIRGALSFLRWPR
jgi:hypothetical protein